MKALVVDDDRVLADLVAFTLRREGFQVMQAHDGEAALNSWASWEPDLIVLDVNLPGIDGFEVCRRIREESDTPLLLLTVRDEEDDVVLGLGLGADDYITKPFGPRQLIARAQAVLRRSGKAPVAAHRQAGLLALDPIRREVVFAGGPPITLTPLQSRLLEYLMLNRGHILTAEAIIEHVWGPEGGDRDMLRQLVHRLRERLDRLVDPAGSGSGAGGPGDGGVGDGGDEPTLPRIETVPGLGYGLTLDVERHS
jgi:DNA-binding response OmpR family regulator